MQNTRTIAGYSDGHVADSHTREHNIHSCSLTLDYDGATKPCNGGNMVDSTGGIE